MVMSIKKIVLVHLPNEEHFDFSTEFRDLIIRFNPTQLNVADVFNNLYLPVYAQEDEAFMFIRKSSFTIKLSDYDDRRDRSVIGITRLVKASTYHFRPEIADAANRINILLESYGNVAQKSYDKETADITNLVNEFRGTYANDVEILNFREWVDEMDAANQDFDALRKERYTEAAQKTELRMKTVRQETDRVYGVITGQINARMTIEGEEKYLPFVKELNLRIDHYKSRIAQRKGARKSIKN
jgi:hypothetical protein